MKKYYWVKLYQVTKGKSYINNEKVAIGIEYIKDSLVNPTIKSYILEEKEIIMVEKIFPYQVREVKTGITFPIVNISVSSTEDGYGRRMTSPFKKVHTFVFSQEYNLISQPVVSSKDLELYNSKHPDTQKFKNELLEIIKQGQLNVINKIESEKIEKEIEKATKLREKIQLKTSIKNQKQEKIKIRKLQRQFKQERKNI